MSTEKIFETHGNVYTLDATVTDCQATEGGFAVTLDRTPFFPGGGGQEADVGTIDGNSVIRLHEVGEDIVHTLQNPLQVGQTVKCELDVDTRLRRMQNHGGEHIVSGIVNRKYRFNNVGFHMGEDDITIDFDGVLDRAQLCEIEHLANMAIIEDRPISVFFPSPEELDVLEYRSKKALSGRVRIVEIEGFDRCACCAPHLPRTGMVGLIKILDFIHYKGGIRVHLLCGLDALDDYHRRYAASAEISTLLSAPAAAPASSSPATAAAIMASRASPAPAAREVGAHSPSKRQQKTIIPAFFIRSSPFWGQYSAGGAQNLSKCGEG